MKKPNDSSIIGSLGLLHLIVRSRKLSRSLDWLDLAPREQGSLEESFRLASHELDGSGSIGQSQGSAAESKYTRS